MKKFILFARFCIWLIPALPTAAVAQSSASFPKYVVIGAFAHRNNAVTFTKDAQQNSFSARFEMNLTRNLYYVYVTTTYDSALAFSEALKLRRETKYFDAWVYHGGFGEMRSSDARGVDARDIDPVTGRQLVSVAGDQNSSRTHERQASPQQDRNRPTQENQHAALTSVTSPQLLAATNSAEKKLVTDDQITHDAAIAGNPAGGQKEENTAPSTLTKSAPAKIYSKQEATTPLTSEEVVGKNFLFQLYRADNLVIVEGEVEAIDVERSRRMATYQANTPVKVLMPSGNSKHVSFVSQVFGYRKMQREFDPASPSQDLYLDKDGNLVVPFELVRLQKGDIAIMYNVFFFKDAAVMRPESRYEVNNLLELLNENPDYKIRIHGHTNGNASGKIIRMGKPGNFYSLSGTTQGFGSAKKLSEERAIVIKQYLVSSGVSDDRMQIKAWGGKKPIHDKHAVRANENVRVEIEILSE